MFQDKNYDLSLGDALENMAKLKDKSIDLILVDLPYGVTNNKWDIIIPFDQMWKQFNRIKKDNSAMVLTATQPFASMLIMSNLKQFKYDVIWEKTICSGQLNVKHRPLRAHESILVFYDKIPTYNEQKTNGKPYKIKREGKIKRGKTVAPKTHKKDKIIEKEKENITIGTPPTSNQVINLSSTPDDKKFETINNPDQVFNDLFFVYPSYRQELKTNSKKRFDVFCRNGSFNYYYDDHKFIETNDGQLNFFDWADNMYVIDYIEEHYSEIEKDMELRNGKKPSSQKKTITANPKKASTIACEKDIETISQKQRRKRREISESSLKTVHHIKHKSIISFN